MPFNGPVFEPDPERVPFLHDSAAVYCARCGTIYILGGLERDCPSCALADRLDELERRLDRAERDPNEGGQRV